MLSFCKTRNIFIVYFSYELFGRWTVQKYYSEYSVVPDNQSQQVSAKLSHTI